MYPCYGAKFLTTSIQDRLMTWRSMAPTAVRIGKESYRSGDGTIFVLATMIFSRSGIPHSKQQSNRTLRTDMRIS